MGPDTARHRTPIRTLIRTLTLLLTLLLTLAALGPVAAQELTTPADDRAMAQLAWEEFVAANRPADNGDGELEWETWATAAAVYSHRREPPKWGQVNERRIEAVLVQQEILARLEARRRGLDAVDDDDLVEVASSPSEVRYNRTAFDWIALKSLWYLQGQELQYQLLRRGEPVDVVFPAGSVAVKVAWKPLSGDDDPARYYTVTWRGHTYGLVGFHVTSKRFPDWFWATFEQVDNPGRRLVSSYDPFGYPTGDDGGMSQGLRDLFLAAGMSPDLWSHYRLNGEQIAFTDATGRPVVLANSVIEAGVTTRSSCMTCHSRSSIGEQADRLAVEPVVGAPDPSWFWTESDERQPVYLSLDFLWSLTRAKPRLPPEKP